MDAMKKIPRPLSPAAAFLARHSVIIALSVFAIAAAAVLNDCGVSRDEGRRRHRIVSGFPAPFFANRFGDGYADLSESGFAGL